MQTLVHILNAGQVKTLLWEMAEILRGEEGENPHHPLRRMKTAERNITLEKLLVRAGNIIDEHCENDAEA